MYVTSVKLKVGVFWRVHDLRGEVLRIFHTENEAHEWMANKKAETIFGGVKF